MKTLALSALLACLAGLPLPAADYDYRVLATTRTSTMEKEMNEAADAGYVFADVMGGETAVGGKEVVVVMQKDTAAAEQQKRAYRLLATSKTSTMQKELQQLGDEGFDYRGQTVFQSGIAGHEVAVIMERDAKVAAHRIEFRLLATSRTSTLQKELKEAGAAGFHLMGMTVSKTAFGGAELVCILKKD
jgi:opacity protein-like surface antigen